MQAQLTTPATKPSKPVLIMGVIIAFLFPLILSILVNKSLLAYADKVFYSRFIFWVEVALLWLYARLFEKQGLLIWTEKEKGFTFIAKAVGILYLLALGAQFISAIPTLLGFHENDTVMKQIALLVKGHPLLLTFIAFTAGFTEEIIFRGYMLTRLSLLFTNKYVPVIISSVLFAALHYRFNSPREYIFPFLIGVITSMHYQKFGNIKPLIIVHFLIDMIGLLLASQFIK
jgi:membrane protease YdiL (CAAX protease family)